MSKKRNKEYRKRHHKKWLKKHPEYVLKRLERWIKIEKDPEKKKEAKAILKRHLEEFKKSAALDKGS